MARAQAAADGDKPAGRRPGVILALAVAALTLAAAGTASVWGTGGLHLSALACQTELRLTQQLGPSTNGRNGSAGGSEGPLEIKKYVGDADAVGNCTVPKLDVAGLEEYGCRVLNDSCFDQHRIIVYNPPDDLQFVYPFVDMGWTETWSPGWAKLNKTAAGPIDVGIVQPQVRKNSSEDRPDQIDPIFSSCFTPLVWNSPYHIAYGEFFDNSFVPLWDMQTKRKLFDRNILLAPVMDGYRKQQFMENLLRPYTTQRILTFNDISSRQHMYDPKFPRCFKKVALCGLKGLYKDRPEPKSFSEELNVTIFDGDKNWTWYQPARAGKALVDFYQKAGKIPALTATKKDKTTLQILLGNRTDDYRLFRNLTQFLERCNAWKPPAKSGYQRTRCLAHSFSPTRFLTSLAVLQQTDILVAHHGAELSNGFFLPWGSSVVEVRMAGFPDDWAGIYYPSFYRTENEIFYWTAKVVGDESWEPAAWERDGSPAHLYEMERHTRLRWEQWEPILANISSIRRSKEAYEARKYPQQMTWLI